MRVSLAMIVRNEEATIRCCLESARAHVDEIVVLDTGSTDRTSEIARELGAEVHHSRWNDDYSQARNDCLKHVRSDWVLVLDADEVLAEPAVPQIRCAIRDTRILAINLLRHEVGAGQAPYSMVSRLFRRHPSIFFRDRYHATIDDSVAEIRLREPHWTVGQLEGVSIVHNGYAVDAVGARKKQSAARRMLESQIVENPNDAYCCCKLGALYLELGEVEKGIETLKRGLLSDPQEPALVYELNFHLGIAKRRAGDKHQSVDHYLRAIRQPLVDVVKIGAYMNMAAIEMEDGRPLEACRLYERVASCAPDYAKGHNYLGLARRAQGDIEGAVAAYRRAIDCDADYGEAYQNLAVALFKAGRVNASLSAFRSAISKLEKTNLDEAVRLKAHLTKLGLTP